MSWRYNPKTMRTEPEADGVLKRAEVDEAIVRLLKAGIRNRNEIADCLSALTGLTWGEVAFAVNLVCDRSELIAIRK
ncbi:MAG TPA: hypothetical protein VHV55_26565 [Pirellulales bacterium]|jgi:hypothetical protein|nr:hypothetical protein [Pirellulales bacterium]